MFNTTYQAFERGPGPNEAALLGARKATPWLAVIRGSCPALVLEAENLGRHVVL